MKTEIRVYMVVCKVEKDALLELARGSSKWQEENRICR